MFHPLSSFAIQPLHNGDVGHGSDWRSAMPVFLPWRSPDHVSRANFLNPATPLLNSAVASRDDQRLAQRVGVPGAPGAGLEGYTGCLDARWIGRLDQGVNTHTTGKIPSCSPAGWL